MGVPSDTERKEMTSVPNPADCLVRQTVDAVLSQREEVLRAFIAKYGFEPDRAIQIEQVWPDGKRIWYLRRMTDKEMLDKSMIGAEL